MKEIIFIFTVVLLSLSTACSGGQNGPNNLTPSNDSIANETVVDSLAITLNRLDSIQNKGQLVHFDTWKIGNLKSVEIQVQKFSSNNKSIVFINLRKDCGGEYYYSWENAHLFQEELPYLYEAINTIKNNLNRETDHNEKYAYSTKDNIVVFAENLGKGWNLKLSVDANNSNAYINLTAAELDKLLELLQQANKKLDTIK